MSFNAMLVARLSDWSASPWALVVVALAVWRATSLIVREDGPWDMLARIRHWAGVRFDASSEAYGTNVLAEGMTCIFCTSVWIGLLFACGWMMFPLTTVAVALPLALSAAAIIIERVT